MVLYCTAQPLPVLSVWFSVPREDRAGVLVDQHLLQADRLQWVVVAAVAVAVGRWARRAQLAEDNLVHLADLLLQRHAAQQVLNARGNRCLPVEVPGSGGQGALGREQGAGEGEHGQKNGGDGEPFPPPDHLSLPGQFGQRRRRRPSHWTNPPSIPWTAGCNRSWSSPRSGSAIGSGRQDGQDDARAAHRIDPPERGSTTSSTPS